MCRITKSRGQYNWCSNEEQTLIVVYLPEDAPTRSVSELWSENEPDIRDMPPSEVIAEISKRLESYLISTGRDEKRKIIEWCRANSERLDSEWAKNQIEVKRREIKSLEEDIKDSKGLII